jgi:uroporphyrinogen-III synthase
MMRHLPTVLVTRPQPQAEQWAMRLHDLGVPAKAFPLLQTAALDDTALLTKAYARVADSALVMFVSPNAVAHWRAWAPAGWAWPHGVLAGATGPGTCQALRDAGVPEHAIAAPPEAAGRFDSEALWQQIAPMRHWAGARVMIVRGEGGRDWLADTLRTAGAQVQFVEAYRRIAPQLDIEARILLVGALADPERCVWLFSSSEAVGHLPALMPGADWSCSRALATHPRIVDAALALGCQGVKLVAPTAEAVAEAVKGAPIQFGRP